MTDEYRVDDPVVPNISTKEDLPERIRIAKATQHAVGSHGFVQLIDAFGSDQDIAEAARTSYGEGTRQLQKDSHLLRYLMRHRHSTPFEMCEIKLLVQVPMDIWRQWIRHRTANVNEYSTRYSKAIDAMSETSVDDWRRQSTTNRQGSALPLDQQWPENFEMPSGFHKDDMSSPGHYLTRRERDLHVMAREVYEERLQFGVAREQARKDLPLSNYTRAYWKCDLHNLLHFLSLRMDSHAQKEIRDYANVVGQIAQALWPATWAAFVAYRLEAVSLSAMDIAIVSAMQVVRSAQPNVGDLELLASTLPKTWTVSRHRERDELLGKLSRLGLLFVTKEIADIYFQGT